MGIPAPGATVGMYVNVLRSEFVSRHIVGRATVESMLTSIAQRKLMTLNGTMVAVMGGV